MWKDYSSSYIKNNRTLALSVKTAALICALLLSLLCSLYYNLWVYELERIKLEEGSWQGRITGAIDTDTLHLIQNYANVKKAVINEELSDGQNVAADIYFKNMRTIPADMPRIAKLAGLPPRAASCHHSLLNMYLIRDPDDSALRWVFPFSLTVMVIACLSLILIIHNAFTVTMQTRIHQFGIFASIGAAPGQIRACLMQEAFALCAIPIAAGTVLGTVLSMGILKGTDLMLADIKQRLVLPFACHPLVLIFSLLISAVTIWISAWIPARRISKMTPLEAIRNTGELHLKHQKNSRILSFLFGTEGELAGNALKAQQKSMRTATLSLIFSFLTFSLMMCFVTIAVISQDETYFAKYQDAWDVMVTVKDTGIDTFEETKAVQEIPGIKSGVVYQRAAATCRITEGTLSKEMLLAGGFDHAPKEYVSFDSDADAWTVNAPLMILDDASFLKYCEQIGAAPRLDGAVIRNQLKDPADPNFRKRRTLPYLTGTKTSSLLTLPSSSGDPTEDQTCELPVLAYTQEVPALREEYGTLDLYELVHFIPVSLWKEIKGETVLPENDTYIRILAETKPQRQQRDTSGKSGRAFLAKLNTIEEILSDILAPSYDVEIENRIQEKHDNDNMINGMLAILSVFCVLLAAIGIGNIFSYTLGFVRIRRREFARYLSIGLTPAGMRKIFRIEALVIAGRPILITLPVTILAVALFLKISCLEPMLFLRNAPILPVLVFLLAIFGFVALAYRLGAKRVLESSLADSLRDDTFI